MEPAKGQFPNVVSLAAKREEKQAARSPFGPIQTGLVKPKPRDTQK